LSTSKAIAIYAHFPWCVEKCPYCDFNSHQVKGDIEEQRYIERLLQDLRYDVNQYLPNQPIVIPSIFMGGGTPSLFSSESIADFLNGVKRISGDSLTHTEVTLEANPGTFEQQKFRGFREAGVNRLSIGVQSFDPLQLHNLGRIHSSDEALQAIAMAKAAGFDNFNIDLMFGLPGQTIADAKADLLKAIALEPTHLSWYQLTLEPNTVFYSKPPTLPDDDLIADMHEEGIALLLEHGYIQYEVSAFAKNNKRSIHNQIYWRYDDYLGLGAGAHGKLTIDNQVFRTQRTRLPKHYLDATPAQNNLSPVDTSLLSFEYMLNRLRLREPFSDGELRSLLDHQSTALLDQALNTAVSQNLLTRDGNTIETTDLGWRHLNHLMALFLTEDT